jgi:gas vesicle protein
MQAVKTIVKTTFLWAFVLGFAGIWVGAVAAIFIWPNSNLGPPVRALYGIFIGILLGAIIGFVIGIVRSRTPRVAHQNPEKMERLSRMW